MRSGPGLEPEGATGVLVHNRLSILDLSDAANQPMLDDGDVAIAYNGEVYNYRELRQELVMSGCRFRSTGDTEVVLKAYRQWGLDSLRKLVGMFAFAIVDGRRRKLILARDFMGIKPLYYRVGPGSLAFASEIKVLIHCLGLKPTVDAQALNWYCTYGITDAFDNTLFEGVKQVPPGTAFEIDFDAPEAMRLIRYWSPDASARCDLSFAEAASRLRELFLESVALHLRSDVPLGAALSGGIDSSAVVCAMRELGGPKAEIRTYSFIADDPVKNESKWIERVARHCRVENTACSPSGDDLAAVTDRLVWAQDEPFTSTSVFAHHSVQALAARDGTKVILDGQGADELLGGYRYFLGAKLADLLRRGRAAEAWRALLAMRRLPGLRVPELLAGVFSYAGLGPAAAWFRAMVRNSRTARWVKPDWFRDRCVARQPIDVLNSNHPLRDYLTLATMRLNLPHLLHWGDRNSMACSIEGRVPFLTPRLVEFVMSLPTDYIIDSQGTSKAVFRSAMSGLVPEDILGRRDKLGFETTEQDWLRSARSWVTGTLKEARDFDVPYLDLERIIKCCEQAADGTPSGLPIWRIVTLLRWTRIFGATAS